VNFEEQFVFFWFLASVVTPLIVLGGLNGHIRRQIMAKGIPVPEAKITLVGILLIISIVAILAALLLPALASAKRKAMSVSLMSDLKQIDIANRMAKRRGLNPVRPALHLRRAFAVIFPKPCSGGRN